MFGLDFLKKLKPCSWKYKNNNELQLKDDLIFLGFIAQDLHNVLQSDDYALVQKNKENGYYMVDKSELIGPIVKAIQEIDSRLTVLENSKEK